MGDLLVMPVKQLAWKPLDYSKLPIVESCGLCEQPMHLLKVNEHVCFWVHDPVDAKKCKAPIAFKTSFTHGVKEFLQNKLEGLKENVEKGRNTNSDNKK